MTIKEKQEEMTSRVKQKLDEVNYRIFDINSFFSEDNLLRDLTRQSVIITRFTETTLQNSLYLITDFETLEMLYVQTGPTSFVDIDVFFSRE